MQSQRNKSDKNVKIVIVGGHFTPALAVLEEFQKRKYKNIIWIGVPHTTLLSREKSFERRTVETRNVRSIFIAAGKFSRYWRGKFFFISLLYLFLIPIALIRIFFILLKERPRAIIGFGGYLSAHVSWCAKILRIPFFLHEQTTVFSLSSKLSAPFSEKIFTSFERSEKDIESSQKKKVVRTGNPINAAILNAKERDLSTLFSLGKGKKILYITGGNQGAESVNDMIFKEIESIFEFAHVVHQIGSLSKESEEMAQKIKEKHPSKYHFFKNADPETHATLLKNADLVISRGGANSISELMYLKTPAIIIPLPHARNDEQRKNAEELGKYGNGIVKDIVIAKDIRKMLEKKAPVSNSKDGENNRSFLPQEKIVDEFVKFLEK